MTIETETRPDRGSGPGFAEEYAAAIGRLRETLARILTEVGVDPTRPQEIARRFQLNKNLTWKLSRLLREDDPATALRFVPGTSGLRILLDAFASGAPRAVAAAEEAARQFADMQARHAGDRATLEMLIAGVAHDRIEPEAFEQARRQAFLGNASIWGVQARTQFSTYLLAPNERDEDWADIVLTAGLVDFRRTRPDARWILGTRQAFGQHGELVDKEVGIPLEPPPHGPSGVPLLPDFCSSPLPRVETVRSGLELRYELPGGTVGNSSLTTVAYAELDRRAGPRFGDPREADGDDSAAFAMNLQTPTEHAQFDLFVHRALGWRSTPSFAVYGRLHGGPSLDPSVQADRRLPTQENLQRLTPEELHGDRVPNYRELVQRVTRSVGWALEDFDIWRISMAHPPIPSAAVLSVDLPRRG